VSAATRVDDPLAEARELARKHRLRIVPVTDPAGRYDDGRERFRTSYVVYRLLPGGGSTRIGKRADPSGLLSFVRKAAGVAA
jgi:CBS domain-containing protein